MIKVQQSSLSVGAILDVALYPKRFSPAELEWMAMDHCEEPTNVHVNPELRLSGDPNATVKERQPELFWF